MKGRYWVFNNDIDNTLIKTLLMKSVQTKLNYLHFLLITVSFY